MFHKFYWLMWTTAQIVLGVNSVVSFAKIADFSNPVEIADFIYGLVTVILMVTYFIGFFKWKLYGWYALMAQLVINVAYAFASLFISFGTVEVTSYALVIGTLIRCIPVGIYYYNRKPLFTKQGSDYPAAGFLFAPPQRPNNPWNNQNGNMPDSQPHNMPQNQDMWQNSNVQNTADSVKNGNTALHGSFGNANQPQQTAPHNPNFDEKGERIYFCPNCGQPVKQSSNFCLDCGAKLK